MRILAIETSCDETAISLIETTKSKDAPAFSILGEAIYSQTKIHEKWGGVVPSLAKREHAKNLVPLLENILKDANAKSNSQIKIEPDTEKKVSEILAREGSLADELNALIKKFQNPNIDAIAVTYGPGLEPALWVGVNFAKALSLLWKAQLIPIDHMEGHIFSALFEKENTKHFSICKIGYPAIALLVSGGHTELVLIKEPFLYEILGQTRDDAVGEAYDKVGRILDLPYPGGPEISRIAEESGDEFKITLPRPMIHSNDFDFSFSGIKTAVLYAVKKIHNINDQIKADIACEFEKAVTDVLVSKTARAVDAYNAKTVLIGGGVSANKRLRHELKVQVAKEFPDAKLRIPEQYLTTDNATMIAGAAYVRILYNKRPLDTEDIQASGNLVLK